MNKNNPDGFSQTAEEFIEALEGLGFQKVLQQDIPNDEWGDGKLDQYYIFWRNGILLTFDTYWGGKSVNSANAYFNYKRRGEKGRLRGCGGHVAESIPNSKNYDIYIGSRDAREGLRLFIEEAEQNGEFLQTWIQRPFLWLLHYMDEKVEGYDYKAINATRIAQLPEEVQNSIIIPDEKR